MSWPWLAVIGALAVAWLALLVAGVGGRWVHALLGAALVAFLAAPGRGRR